MKKLITLTTLLIFLSGCQAAFTRLPDASTSVSSTSKSVSMTVPGGWVRFNSSASEHDITITKDGPYLQMIEADSAGLDKPFENLDIKLSQDTLISELAEHYEANLRAGANGVSVERISMKPATIDGKDGFRLEARLVGPSGLEVKTLAYGALHNKRLYTVSYLAPELFYFERDLPAFETMVSSVKLK